MGTVQQPKKHHFVPEFYQRAWAGDDGQVEQFTRPHRDVDVIARRKYPGQTGYEKHLYDLHGAPADRRAFLETAFFRPIDTAAATAHQLMLAGKLNDLTNQQRVDWARFMMSMQSRDPHSLGEIHRLANQVMQSKLASPSSDFTVTLEDGTTVTAYEWMQKNDPVGLAEAYKTFLPGLIDHEELGKHLINMCWRVLDVYSASHSLLTSDRPFIVVGRGWKDQNAVLLFPLSPSRLFVATNSLQQMRRVLDVGASKLVRLVNDAIVRQAVDYVYGLSDSHLAFIRARFRDPDQEPIPGPVGKGRPGCPS